MKTGAKIQLTPLLKFLTYEQMEEIHLATLEVLAETGVEINNAEALELLAAAGAIIEGKIVKFPETLVKQALVTAPSRIVLANRDGERCIFAEGRRSYFGTGSCCPYTIDPFTGERRLAVKQDVANMATVCDYLPNIDFMMSTNLVRDKYADVGYIHEFDAMARNSKKPIIMSCGSGQNVRDLAEMAETIMGGPEALRQSPLLAVYSESTSPLRHADDALQKTLVCAEKWIPIIHTIGELMGATAPATVAGALIQANAELLSVLVIHQLKQPGAPFFYGGTISAIDMRTMVHQYGNPEFHLCSAALVELGADYYKLPIFNTGGCSDSKDFDEQAAAEGAYSLLMEALAGGNLIHDIGFIDSGLTSSLPLVVFSNEMIGMIKHITNGIGWSEDELAMDAIRRVGPGGEYLTDEHTYRHFKALNKTDMFERASYTKWEADGGLTLGQKVKDRTRWIIENHKCEALKPEIASALDALIEKYTAQAAAAE